ncbi:LytR/AlgR family response regulator transcription factor [Tenacibaculum agarivorans]|uniref:LytR/AlgR family response regulator transcription factor n=1 Tax=Tenacibaculum agarivorans TaxID=1908389 RepID=UPI00094B843B|nr:LytTR family DNA-binding domain-containing protein [Tenacibaculum agarivorans]
MKTNEQRLESYNYISLFEKNATNKNIFDYLLNFLNVNNFTALAEKVKTELLTYQHQKKTTTSTISFSEKIILKDKYGIQIVNINDIYYLQANGSYTEFFIKDQDSLVTSKCLKEYQNVLPSANFFRSHQSYIVNLNHLIRYDKREGDFLVLKNGYKTPLASRKKELFLKLLSSKK